METLARSSLIEASVMLSELRGSKLYDALGPKRTRLSALSCKIV
jgi:hypothetical protein